MDHRAGRSAGGRPTSRWGAGFDSRDLDERVAVLLPEDVDGEGAAFEALSVVGDVR